MRRPRGPGGRFLTAEEIAAQKLVQQPTSEENTPAVLIDSPDLLPNEGHALAPSPLDQRQSQNRILPAQDSIPAGLTTTTYNISHTKPSPPALSPPLPSSFPDNRQPSATHIPPPVPTQSPPVQTNTQSSPILPQSHLSQHPGKPSSNPSVTLRSPYSQAQMHHVPHPHAHTRLRHSHLNFTDGLYQAEESPQVASAADNSMMAYSSQTGN